MLSNSLTTITHFKLNKTLREFFEILNNSAICYKYYISFIFAIPVREIIEKNLKSITKIS